MNLGKVHDLIILKNQAIYENGINIASSIWAYEIVDINGMAPERKITEEAYMKKEIF